jgi:hypothetical protein
MKAIRELRGPIARVSLAEQRRRMIIIEQLFIEYHQVDRVARMCAAGIDLPDGTRFRVGRSTALNYIRKIEERWVKEAEALRPYRMELHRRALVNHIRGAKGDKKWSAISSLSRLLADIDGVIAPQKHQVAVDASGSLLAAFDGWTDDDKLHFAQTGLRPGEGPADEDDPFGQEGHGGNGSHPSNGGNGVSH